MTHPAYSVIIPLYNAAGTLEQAIRSVLDQSVQDFEILIVDDRSTDGSYDLAVAWADADDRIRVLQLPKNSGGPIRPRNLAIEHARGTFFAFLDADDRWMPTKLETQRSRHEAGAYALTYSRCVIEAPEDPAMDGSDYHEWWRLVPGEGSPLTQLVRSNFVPVLTAVIHREWAERIGPFGGVNGAEDWHYWIRVAAYGGTFGFIDEPLAVYRWTSTNLSSQSPISAMRRKTETLRVLAKEVPEHRSLFVNEERQVRERATNLWLRRFPAPVRAMARRVLLPPRLWIA